MALTYASDSIALDTSHAPWMTIARAQGGITEGKDLEKFKQLLWLEATSSSVQQLVSAVVGPIAQSRLQAKNPVIADYLKSVKVSPVVKETKAGWQMQSWCAAFVNWCLMKAESPTHGTPTAAAWLQFGTPIPAAVFGCVVVFEPLASTGSSTGHVAFYDGDMRGEKIAVLGGNQSGKVQRSEYPIVKVRGYRWPTGFNYLLSSGRA